MPLNTSTREGLFGDGQWIRYGLGNPASKSDNIQTWMALTCGYFEHQLRLMNEWYLSDDQLHTNNYKFGLGGNQNVGLHKMCSQ